MNPLVVTTVVVTVGTTEMKRVIAKQGFSLDPVLAGFILGLFLFALTDAVPRVGRLFCILIIVTALILNGATIFPTISPASTAQGLVYFNQTPSTTKVA